MVEIKKHKSKIIDKVVKPTAKNLLKLDSIRKF